MRKFIYTINTALVLSCALILTTVPVSAQKHISHADDSPLRDESPHGFSVNSNAGGRWLGSGAADGGGAAGQTGNNESSASRVANREKLSKVLDKAGPMIGTSFKRSTKQPFNFVGFLSTGLSSAESFEIVIGVTNSDTIGFRVYPHYAGNYINVDKVKNNVGLMRKLLQLSDTGFFYWGIDPSNDVFAGYTFTLESGFPEDALVIVLRSITNLDKFVGEIRPFVDGTSAPPPKPAPTSNF